MKVTGVRTYDSLNEKWKNLRRKMAHFCGVYNNATRRSQSGARHEDYTHKTLEGDKVMKKATTSSMPSTSSTAGSDEALARFMVTEYASQNESFLSIKKEDRSKKLSKSDKACLSLSWALVLDNGSPTLEFSIKHGLRQGDPLSPFLFIVAMERLHNTLSTAVSSGLIRGVKFDSPEVTISHLFYADDVVITTEWNANDLDNIIRVLQIFYLASGLRINIQKSNVYGMGFRMSISLPWPVLLDKFQSKLSSWKANLISIGGCHTLIKVVLGSLVALEVVIAQERALVKVIKALHGQRYLVPLAMVTWNLQIIFSLSVILPRTFGCLFVNGVIFLFLLLLRMSIGKVGLLRGRYGGDIKVTTIEAERRGES
ncbi:putative RNA-directed DNA polymerase, eukaryota, reverse transcriptase zinc-binding domain protein [Tanacetum coccineum]